MPKHQRRDNSPPVASQRQLRVGELIRHALADMLSRGDVHDPVLEKHMITVPEVAMTADLRLATIYVMPLGGKGEKEVVAALERNKKFLRTELAHRINLKFAPDIRFRADERFDEAERIEKILRTPEVRRDLAAQELLVAFERRDNGLSVAPAERHHVDRRKAQVGGHSDFRHCDHVLFQHRIVHVAARQHVGERVADQFADAKLALRGDGRRIVAALVFGHQIRPEKICFVMLRTCHADRAYPIRDVRP